MNRAWAWISENRRPFAFLVGSTSGRNSKCIFQIWDNLYRTTCPRGRSMCGEIFQECSVK
jgi:hypothetical protein